MKAKSIPRVVRPRCECGVDWGNVRHVLMRYKGKELQWHLSSKCFSGIGMPQRYCPTTLVLADVSKGAGYSSKVKDLQEGGRLSTKLILKHAKEIDEFFGSNGVHKQLLFPHLLRFETIDIEIL